MNLIYAGLVMLTNIVVNKLPSRRLRNFIYRCFGSKIGKNTVIFRRAELLNPRRLIIEDNSSIGWFTLLDARGGISIGKNVNVSSYSKLITGNHDIDSPMFEAIFLPIVIEDFVWVCTGATILQNVTIGKGAVICAGAVVTKNVPAYAVVAGIPAKVIRYRNKDIKYTVPKAPFLH